MHTLFNADKHSFIISSRNINVNLGKGIKMKKIIIKSCYECRFLYDPNRDPYPDVGWRLPKCGKINKILWKDEINSIPDWCPLEDNI